MARLHHCSNGNSVTDQVLIYQKSQSSDDYLEIKKYYDNYKELWFGQLHDYMDRITFESEYDYKLCKAVRSFDMKRASNLANTNNWTYLGMFNRWFYRILSNWKSNAKTSSFRLKKRSPVQCPICGRFVGRITEEHLQHYKSLRDLPSVLVWEGDIYEVCTTAKRYVYTWGSKTSKKIRLLLNNEYKPMIEFKKRVRWRWYDENEQKGVLCPFVNKVMKEITNEYLLSLPDKYNRYAPPTSWFEFSEKYPSSLIQSEIYSLDHMGNLDEETCLKDHISKTRRTGEALPLMDYEMIVQDKITTDYEYIFRLINKHITDETSRMVLKLISADYTLDDIGETLCLSRKDIKTRIKQVKADMDLETKLKE